MSTSTADSSAALRGGDGTPTDLKFDGLGSLPVAVLSIGGLLLDDSPRLDGENSELVRILAELEEQLPPILVHAPSMRVIDGIHRVRAAAVRGMDQILARIYNGPETDAFVLAVKMNVTHGLPLTRTDRTVAAARIIGSHPQWSNRMIAAVTGLSAGTVSHVRQRSTAQNAQSNMRVGQDGRVRPLETVTGRLKASHLLVTKPNASLRAIAKEAGVSPSTVHDVRRRLRARRDPVPKRQRPERAATARFPAPSGSDAAGVMRNVNIAATLTQLMGDPSLRFSEAGRSLLRWLDRHGAGIERTNEVVATVPAHCAATVARLAREYAKAWASFAEELEERHRQTP